MFCAANAGGGTMRQMYGRIKRAEQAAPAAIRSPAILRIVEGRLRSFETNRAENHRSRAGTPFDSIVWLNLADDLGG